MVTSSSPGNTSVLILPSRQDYTHPAMAKKVQSNQIRTKLDIQLLALNVLTGINSDSILRVASKLNIPPKLADELTLVVDEKRGVSANKPLKTEEVKSFILIVCHLAKQNQSLIRRAVALMEQVAAQNTKPQSVTLLREYLDKFEKAYKQYHIYSEDTSHDNPEKLGLKLLVDLLFYSAPQGCSRLWSSLKF
ncbi:MAG: DUF3038 domain-containing protein [Okeania sp. SIO2C9]|uniref:DUF3038 domain-containing protein n=1 Tax=Okeania sp. SIO2C9 TaxID=2607791 RepID=UPI0013C0E1FD|nr:DUF3038 domain-containing protein [Okeania sp. SIO2C9]NEQ75708.1 DUF3038 domain-containing protein [Okeania sp. SIO2C9]